jgi:hypothetical protein
MSRGPSAAPGPLLDFLAVLTGAAIIAALLGFILHPSVQTVAQSWHGPP